MHRFIIPPALFLLPVAAFAQSQPQTFSGFVDIILNLIQLLTTAIFGLTFVVLIWAIVRTWVIEGGDDQSVAEGRKIVTVGIIVLVIMSGLWGIVSILRAGLFDL